MISCIMHNVSLFITYAFAYVWHMYIQIICCLRGLPLVCHVLHHQDDFAMYVQWQGLANRQSHSAQREKLVGKKVPSILTLFNVQSSTTPLSSPFSGDNIKSSIIVRVFSISSPSMTNVLLRLCPRGSFSISFDILANSPWEHFLLLEFSLPIWLILSYHNACSSYHPFSKNQLLIRIRKKMSFNNYFMS